MMEQSSVSKPITNKPLTKRMNYLNIYSWIAMVLLFIMMVLGTIDVLGRYFINKPIKGTLEWSELMLAGIVFFGWASVQAADEHVKVDMVIRRFSPRVQAIAKLFGLFLSFIIFGLYGWRGVMMAIDYSDIGRLVLTINVPMFWFELMVPLGALAVFIVMISQVRDTLKQLKKGGGGLR
jgi:TRAP-type transport system small permease protein